MKKIFTIILLSVLCVKVSHAQVIQSITMVPANPTSNDPITIFAECMFFSGGCSDHTQYVYSNGSQIYANALHCIGPLAFICNYTDTFKLNPLPVGNYTFIFQLDAGAGPSPCTPGIVAGPVDSIHFNITLPVGLTENNNENVFAIYPNPAGNEISLELTAPDILKSAVTAEIINEAGQLVKSIKVSSRQNRINIEGLSSGQYFIRLVQGKGKVLQRLPFSKL